MSTIMQGDEYGLRIGLRTKNGTAVTPENVSDLEITLGRYRKTYLDGEVTWDGEKWVFPMTQEMSFTFKNQVACEARAKFTGGDVIGVFIETLDVIPSQSRVVL